MSVQLEPDKAVAKVQDKFRLDLTDEEAIAHLEGLLNETSSWASVLDRIHAAAQVRALPSRLISNPTEARLQFMRQ
jgi:hypothetical protein